MHHASHLFAAAQVRGGPSNDSPDFAPAVTQAVQWLPIGTLYADKGFDAEANHRLARRDLGITRTVIPLNRRRGHHRLKPRTPYRRRMYEAFPKRAYGQRWQIESGISQHKRVLGSVLKARTQPSRDRECLYRVLAHNLMILWPCARKWFLRSNLRFQIRGRAFDLRSNAARIPR